MITDVPGVRVGHWTDPSGRTGCTVVLLPLGTTASGEVRGGAPGTREWDLLSPERMVQHVDAVVLSGGSAYGLAAADGVSAALGAAGRGVMTAGGPVPIVVGAVVYDLVAAAGVPRPGAGAGRAALDSATDGPVALGAVGAGAGATVGKWRGRDGATPGGIGSVTHRHGELIVSALMVVNAWGSIVAAGEEPDPAGVGRLVRPAAYDGTDPRTSTTIGVVATNARLTKTECLLVAQSAHDGLARALWPVHTTGDGDAVVACSVGAEGGVDADLDVVRMLAVTATAAAIRSAPPDA